MSNKLVKENQKNKKQGSNILPIAAGIVVVLAIAIFFGKNIVDSRKADNIVSETKNAKAETKASGSKSADVENEKVKVQTSELSEQVTFVDYDSKGTKMEVMLVKTPDGVIRGALNTCQVCNGSPYAYFEQQGDKVICQNCHNQFLLTDIGVSHGGCNPVPIDFKEQDGYVVIDTAILDQNASRFIGWKQGV